MNKQTLIQTNPYLRDPVKRREMFIRNVITSSAIEGIKLTKAALATQSGSRRSSLKQVQSRR